MTPRTALLALGLLAALACSPPRIPGTDIRSTPDTRAIVGVLEAYREAMEKRDAAAVLALVAPNYYDNAGTPDPKDDLDRALLEKTLPTDLAKADSLKLDLTVRRIDVNDGKADVEVFYDQYYRVQTPSGLVPRRDSDIHRMRFEKIDGSWKIASGL